MTTVAVRSRIEQAPLERVRERPSARAGQAGEPHGRALLAHPLAPLARANLGLGLERGAGAELAEGAVEVLFGLVGEDHPDADGVVRERVDQDERAGRAVLRVGVEVEGAVAGDVHLADVVQREALGGELLERVHVLLPVDALDLGAHELGRVLDQVRLLRVELALAHPDDVRVEDAAHVREVVGVDEHVAAADVDLVLEPDHDRLRAERGRELAVERVDDLDARALARRERDDVVPPRDLAGRDLAREAPVGQVRAEHVLDREPEVLEVPVARDRYRLEVLEHRAPLVPRRARRVLRDDVRALERADREERDVLEAERAREVGERLLDARVDRAVVPDEIHLVHAHGEMRDPEERRDVRVPPRLLEHAEPRVDQDERHVRRRGPRDHVPRVLNVARRVGDDELARFGREVTVRDVDRDPLLALRSEAVCEEREVDLLALHGRRAPHGLELILVDHPRVVEEPADQRRLAVVDRADADEPKELLLLVALEVRFDVLADEIALAAH